MQQGNPFDRFDAPAGAVPPPVIMGPAKRPDVMQAASMANDAERLAIARGGAALDRQRLDLSIAGDQRDRAKVAIDASKESFDQTKALRNDYLALPSVKNYTNALPGYAAGLASKADSAGDLNLIYAYAKVMDPNSVVREGEQASVANSDTWVNATTARLRKELTGEGGTFQPELRKRLREEMANRMGQLNEAYIADRVWFKQQSDRAGLNALDVVGEHPGGRFQKLSEDVLGRPQKQLDYNGQPIALPAVRTDESVSIERDFGDSGRDKVNITPAQENATQAWLAANPNATGEQLNSFLGTLNLAPDPDANGYMKKYRAAGGRFGGLNDTRDAEIKADATRLAKADGRSDVQQLVNQGASFGGVDELSGIVNAGAELLGGNLDVNATYRAGRDAVRMKTEEARQNLGWGGTAAEIGGGLIGFNPTSVVTAATRPSVLGRVADGARVGSGVGALSGFLYGDGTEKSLVGAAGGGALGAFVGAATPVAGEIVRNRVGGLSRLLGRDGDVSRRIVNDAITADGNTPRGVATMLTEARGRGSPLAIADTGENTRALLGSVGRQPGASRTLTRDAVVNRQLEQGDRISAAATRDLGPALNIRGTGDELIEQAKMDAAPLYERFYAAPGASSVKIDDLAARPSFKRALTNARNLADEEGIDPTALGFDLDDAGEVILTRVPSFQTLDYVKRGLDDVVETYRDPTSRRLNLDEGGRATNNTLRMLVNRIDAVAPYAEARAAYAGPTRMKEALERGFKALNRSADDVATEIASLGGDAERRMYAAGVRKAVGDVIEGRVDGADKVGTLLGTPKKRRVLAQVFGGRREFDRFVSTLGDERAMAETYRSVATGSQTAERLAADATTNDGGLAETAVDAALRGSKDGLWPTVINAIQGLRNVSRFGVGEAGETARERIAAHLTETDAAELENLLRAAQRLRARQRIGDRNASRRVGRQSVQIGELAGRLASRDERSRP